MGAEVAGSAPPRPPHEQAPTWADGATEAAPPCRDESRRLDDGSGATGAEAPARCCVPSVAAPRAGAGRPGPDQARVVQHQLRDERGREKAGREDAGLPPEAQEVAKVGPQLVRFRARAARTVLAIGAPMALPGAETPAPVA